MKSALQSRRRSFIKPYLAEYDSPRGPSNLMHMLIIKTVAVRCLRYHSTGKMMNVYLGHLVGDQKKTHKVHVPAIFPFRQPVPI